MKIEFRQEDLTLLYEKAKSGYKKCISNKDNAFLKDEVDVPLESIQLVEKDIKIIFFKDFASEYLLEVGFILLAIDKEIGKYVYVIDEEGQVVDDFLVFY